MSPLPLLLIAASWMAQKADPNWVMTFDEEFNGSELDLLHWSPNDPWGHERDRQLQGWSPDSVTVSGGQLHLIARKTTAAQPVRYDGKDRQYVSGMVTTFGAFAQTYGRFEIRCRVPAGQGLRANVALFPVPLAPLPEIQLLDVSGSAPAAISFANYWGTDQTERSFGDSFPGPDLSTGFHTVSIEWDPAAIAWFVDGKETFRSVEGIPRQQMFLRIDLAVGGGSGSLSTRFPNDATPFPASFDIDYIRVYKRR